MVNEARRNIFVNQWAVIWPAATIASLVIGLNLVADGLREEITRISNRKPPVGTKLATQII